MTSHKEPLVVEELPLYFATQQHGTIKQQVFTYRRIAVPGGWLVFVPQMLEKSTVSREITGQESGVFYPDPEHRWDGGSLPEQK